MNKMLYKHTTDRKQAIEKFFFEESSQKEYFLFRKIKKCSYQIRSLPVAKTVRSVISELAILQKNDPSLVKKMDVVRRYDSKTTEETITMTISGLFFIENVDRLYMVDYEKSVEIYLTPRAQKK